MLNIALSLQESILFSNFNDQQVILFLGLSILLILASLFVNSLFNKRLTLSVHTQHVVNVYQDPLVTTIDPPVSNSEPDLHLSASGGLTKEIQKIFENLSEKYGINANLEISNSYDDIPAKIKGPILDIISELFTNSFKHSGAKEVSIILFQTGNKMRFQYSDDGKGFDKNEVISQKTVGLSHIIDSTRSMNGNLELETSPTMGTTYFIHIPFY